MNTSTCFYVQDIFIESNDDVPMHAVDHRTAEVLPASPSAAAGIPAASEAVVQQSIPQPEPVSEPVLGQGHRRKPGLPRRFRDEPPSPPAPIPKRAGDPPPPSMAASHLPESVDDSPRTQATPQPEPLERVRTGRNAFGLIREYIGRPSHVTDDAFTVIDLLDNHDENSNKHTAPESENGPGDDALDVPPPRGSHR